MQCAVVLTAPGNDIVATVSKFGGAGARARPALSLAALKAVKNNFQSKSRTFAQREKHPSLNSIFPGFIYTNRKYGWHEQ
jgi:hypothetical protein